MQNLAESVHSCTLLVVVRIIGMARFWEPESVHCRGNLAVSRVPSVVYTKRQSTPSIHRLVAFCGVGIAELALVSLQTHIGYSRPSYW